MNTREKNRKLQAAITHSELDGIILTGLRNIQYASGLILPFASARRHKSIALLLKITGDSVLFISDDWADSAKRTARAGEIRTYRNGPGKTELAALIRKAVSEDPSLNKIGIDLEHIPHSLYTLIKEQLPETLWEGCDRLMREVRSIKTGDEQELLKTLAMKADHAINGCLHHITVDRRMSELTLAEEIRVHSLERDVDLLGYNAASQVCAGEETKDFWPNTPKFGYAKTKDLKEKDTIRVQHQHSMKGYWGASARMMVNNRHLSETQIESYTYLNQVRDILLRELQPGRTFSEVFSKVAEAVKSKAIPLAEEFGLGYGIGVSPVEAPFIAASENTKVQKGMVLVLDPVIMGKDGIYRSRDTVIIEEQGAEVIGWYKDWREPYTPIMSI